MAEINYDNQIPVYRNTVGKSFMKLDTTNNRIEIQDASLNKIYVNSQEFSNGTQVLPYVQMYENINAVDACVYPAPNSTTLQVNDTIELNDGTNNALIGIDPSGNLLIDPSNTLIVDGNLDLSCNLIQDVSGIYFCDGTYIGQGSSFDISTNEVLHLKTSQNIILDASNYVKCQSAISAPSFLSLHQFQGFPENSVDITTISSLPSGSIKCRGGVLAPNGKIYCIPDGLTYVIIINPDTNTIDTTSITGFSAGGYWGGVLAPNGKIYCIPHDASSVAIIDPDTNTIDTSSIPVSAGGTKWSGGVLGLNGKIYCIPFNATSVGIIDPNTNTIDTTTISGLPAGVKYGNGVLAPNGKIYCSPLNVNNVGIIDTSNNTIDTTTITGVGGGFSYWGGALAPNGKIYFTPSFSSPSILVINPSNNTTENINTSSYAIPALGVGGFGWVGAVCGLTGYIYCIPFDWSRGECVVIDPNTNTILANIFTGVNNITSLYHCFGGVLAPNGNIYGMPASVSYIPIYKTGLPKIPDWPLNAYFNKF